MDMEKIHRLFDEPAHFTMSIPDLVELLGASERKIRQLIRDMDLEECPRTSCPDLIFRKGNIRIFTRNTPYYVFRTSIIKLAIALMKERVDEVRSATERLNREIDLANAIFEKNRPI